MDTVSGRKESSCLTTETGESSLYPFGVGQEVLKLLISYRSWITSNLYGQLKINEGLVLLNE
jgi:hypothetical protein